VGVRASTGGRFAPGGANGGTVELGWRYARVKERLGTVIYSRWRSVWRSWGQPRRWCTRGVGSKARRRAADQRPNGERRLARRRVEYSHLAPSKRPRASRTVALRRGTWTDGSSGASACARGARTAGWRGARVTSRESALWRRGVKTVC
jgi:hypothetical protein